MKPVKWPGVGACEMAVSGGHTNSESYHLLSRIPFCANCELRLRGPISAGFTRHRLNVLSQVTSIVNHTPCLPLERVQEWWVYDLSSRTRTLSGILPGKREQIHFFGAQAYRCWSAVASGESGDLRRSIYSHSGHVRFAENVLFVQIFIKMA